MALAGEKVALSPEESKSAGLVIGGVTTRLNNDAHFKALRMALGYDSWLASAVEVFDWGRMAAGGGKGGDKMARTNCRRLFIKEVSGGDLDTLSNVSFLKVRRACARGRCSATRASLIRTRRLAPASARATSHAYRLVSRSSFTLSPT